MEIVSTHEAKEHHTRSLPGCGDKMPISKKLQRRGANPKLVVMLRTHVDAPYGTMVSVLDQVKLADAPWISFQREDH